jgi:clan AA aspartic protease (TIGR02281 family)
MTRILVGLVVLLAIVPAHARKVQVPVEGKGAVLVVNAWINQRSAGHFLLDTGASYCVVGKRMAASALLQGRSDGRKVQLSTASGVIEGTIGTARRIDVGDAVARDVDVVVLEKDPFPGLDGILGLSFLRSFKYSIDSAHGVLLLENN